MSAIFSASMRRVYEQAKAAPTPPPRRSPVPFGHMREPPSPTANRLLPFDLQLLSGGGALTLFPKGPFDELCFFQREIDTEHELEYVTCQAQVDCGEQVQAYGLFRLSRGGEELLRLADERELWARLQKHHRLGRLPDPRTILVRAPRSYDARAGEETGRNLVRPPRRDIFRAHNQRPISIERALQVLREVCRPRQLIAWIEAGIPNVWPGRIIHRYYIDARLNVYLVRHKGRKRELFVPRRCAPGEVILRRRELAVPQWPPKAQAA